MSQSELNSENVACLVVNIQIAGLCAPDASSWNVQYCWVRKYNIAVQFFFTGLFWHQVEMPCFHALSLFTGGKTCHIGTLMQNSGVLIALDKAKKKMDTLKSNLLKSGCTIAQVYCQDASKSVQDGSSNGCIYLFYICWLKINV